MCARTPCHARLKNFFYEKQAGTKSDVYAMVQQWFLCIVVWMVGSCCAGLYPWKFPWTRLSIDSEPQLVPPQNIEI